MTISKRLAVSVVVMLLAAPALADPAAAPGTGEARYSFHKVADGFLRLDMQTGDVALCSRHAVGWACVAAPEDRAVLENEIARLRRENAVLKEELLAHGLALPAGAASAPPATGEQAAPPRRPGAADFDRVVALIGRLWHGLVAAFSDAREEALHRN